MGGTVPGPILLPSSLPRIPAHQEICFQEAALLVSFKAAPKWCFCWQLRFMFVPLCVCVCVVCMTAHMCLCAHVTTYVRVCAHARVCVCGVVCWGDKQRGEPRFFIFDPQLNSSTSSAKSCEYTWQSARQAKG